MITLHKTSKQIIQCFMGDLKYVGNDPFKGLRVNMKAAKQCLNLDGKVYDLIYTYRWRDNEKVYRFRPSGIESTYVGPNRSNVDIMIVDSYDHYARSAS